MIFLANFFARFGRPQYVEVSASANFTNHSAWFASLYRLSKKKFKLLEALNKRPIYETEMLFNQSKAN